MKTFGKVIGNIFCLAALFGLCTSGAYAYDIGEKESFVLSDSSVEEHFYVGEVHEGENFLEYNDEYDSYSFFVKFEAQKKGNYAISGGTFHVYELQGSEMKEVEYEIYGEHSIYAYFEESTYYLIDDFFNIDEPSNSRFSIEFLGEYTGVSYNKEAFNNAVAHEDVDFYNGTLRNADPRVNFTEGSLKYGVGGLGIESEKELALGENTVTFEILDHEFTETLTIIDAKDFIESIEVENIERLTDRRCYYNREQVFYYSYPGMITVNFTDGTSLDVLGIKDDPYNNRRRYTFERSDGKEYTIGVYVFQEGFKVEFGGYEYINEEGVYGDVSFMDNLEYFKFNIGSILGRNIDEFEKAEMLIDELIPFCAYLRSYFLGFGFLNK